MIVGIGQLLYGCGPAPLAETIYCSRAGQAPYDSGHLWIGPYEIHGTTLSLRAIASEERVYKGEYHGGGILVSLVNSPGLGGGTHNLQFGPRH